MLTEKQTQSSLRAWGILGIRDRGGKAKNKAKINTKQNKKLRPENQIQAKSTKKVKKTGTKKTKNNQV